MATFMKNVHFFPMPTLLLKEFFLRGKDVKDYSIYCDDLSQYVSAQMVLTMSNWSCLINFSLLLLTAMLLCALCCLSQTGSCCVLSLETRLRHKKWVHECWESTYYLVLLSSTWTPALRCGVYLFTCLCLTLCALHRRSLLCYFQFGWFWNGYEWTAHFNLSYILVHTSLLYHWSSPWPCTSLSCWLTHFLYFDTIFDYIYCPSYSELVKAF